MWSKSDNKLVLCNCAWRNYATQICPTSWTNSEMCCIGRKPRPNLDNSSCLTSQWRVFGKTHPMTSQMVWRHSATIRHHSWRYTAVIPAAVCRRSTTNQQGTGCQVVTYVPITATCCQRTAYARAARPVEGRVVAWHRATTMCPKWLWRRSTSLHKLPWTSNETLVLYFSNYYARPRHAVGCVC